MNDARAPRSGAGGDRQRRRESGTGRGPARERGHRGARQDENQWRPGQERRAERPQEPSIDPEVEPADLDRSARARLRTLSKENADRVAQHLVMAGTLLDSDPELAYEHAQTALRRAGRVDVVREAVALTAYALGRYAEALRELRTVRRLSGQDLHRAVEADCERGLGRPERALALIAEAPATPNPADRVELAIVASGARLDLDEPEAALLTLDQVEGVGGPHERERLLHQRITVLEVLGRSAEAQALQAHLPAPPDEDVIFVELDDPPQHTATEERERR